MVNVFGNAIGNSIVGGIQRSEAEINNRNRYIDAMGQKLTADTARKINGQLATDLNSSLNTTMQGVDASVERMMSANNRNQQIDTTTVKNLGFDKFIVGRTYEKAWAVESSPNILGRVAYNILDIFHD